MFRFTIRELVLVTVVVALGVAWWIDRAAVQRRGMVEAERIQQVADRRQTDMLDWKFRAESLKSDIEKRGGTAIFRQGESGEEVVVKTGTGSIAYYDPRQFL